VHTGRWRTLTRDVLVVIHKTLVAFTQSGLIGSVPMIVSGFLSAQLMIFR
jgi:hypothetical protein